MVKHGRKHTQDAKQASNIVAVGSLVGLTVCFIFAVSKQAQIPLFIYAIFGGGVLGTDNIIKLLKSIFRIDR